MDCFRVPCLGADQKTRGLFSPSTLCRHIVLLFGERLGKFFTSWDKKLSGFTRPQVIAFVADLVFFHSGPVHTLSDSLRICFIPLWRADLFFSRFAVEYAGYVWTVGVSGKSKISVNVWTGPQPSCKCHVTQKLTPGSNVELYRCLHVSNLIFRLFGTCKVQHLNRLDSTDLYVGRPAVLFDRACRIEQQKIDFNSKRRRRNSRALIG